MTTFSGRPVLIPHFSCPHTLSIALETAKKLHWKQNKWKMPRCFLPWLDASSWQNKSLDWELKDFSVLTPCQTKGVSWPAACTGGFRCSPAPCVLDCELLSAACDTGLEKSPGTGCWHCFLVATVKNHLIYMLCHMCAASFLGLVKTLAGRAKSCPLAWLIFGNCSSFHLALEQMTFTYSNPS